MCSVGHNGIEASSTAKTHDLLNDSKQFENLLSRSIKSGNNKKIYRPKNSSTSIL